MKKKISVIVTTVLLIAVLTASLVCFTACDLPTEGYFVAETIRIPYSALSTSLMNYPLGILFKESDSYIEFSSEGICTIKLMLIDIANLISNPLISGLLAGDGTSSEETLDKSVTKEMLNASFIDGYVRVMFPDFDMTDLQGSLASVKKSLGVELVGLDFENNELLKAIDTNLKNTSTDQVLPTDFTISDLSGLPQNIGLVIQGPYCLVDYIGDDGVTYTSALVGEHDSDTQPLMTMSFDDEDGYYVCWENYMLPIKVVFKSAAA